MQRKNNTTCSGTVASCTHQELPSPTQNLITNDVLVVIMQLAAQDYHNHDLSNHETGNKHDDPMNLQRSPLIVELMVITRATDVILHHLFH